ncbi:MAG: type II secretion system GspH family protein [Candidatus Omnitrophica bacterium]|nr:type II secretion system GspH family protein [Candidatus Omnitrophota bacterium]
MKRGFTLIEILITIALIGIVSFLISIRSSNISQQAKITNTIEEMRQLKMAIMGNPILGIKGYYGDLGKLPNSLDDLVNKPSSEPNWDKFTERGWNGPYIQNSGYDKDAWGNNYFYSSINGTITSAGPDGIFGTTDDITINLWK